MDEIEHNEPTNFTPAAVSSAQAATLATPHLEEAPPDTTIEKTLNDHTHKEGGKSKPILQSSQQMKEIPEYSSVKDFESSSVASRSKLLTKHGTNGGDESEIDKGAKASHINNLESRSWEAGCQFTYQRNASSTESLET